MPHVFICALFVLFLCVLASGEPGVAKITSADRICWHQLFAKGEIICLVRSILSSFSGGQTGYQEQERETD